MVKPAHRTPAVLSRPRVTKVAAVALFAAPALLAAACAPNEPVATDIPSTPPAVWTGSTSPAPEPGSGEGTETPSGEGEPLKVELKLADGTPVATATFEFSPGYATVTVQTTVTGELEPGFHGLHIHARGLCEADSTPPTGGAPGDFLSAGPHYQAPGHSGHPASGDLSSLQVRADGSAMLVTTTDAITEEDLTASPGTSIIIHAGADNFANIPDRYTQTGSDATGPDQETLATGDAGGRVACGVISAG